MAIKNPLFPAVNSFFHKSNASFRESLLKIEKDKVTKRKVNSLFSQSPPFHAASVREFWRRWHMTLSRFLSRYIYFPLGQSQRKAAGT